MRTRYLRVDGPDDGQADNAAGLAGGDKQVPAHARAETRIAARVGMTVAGFEAACVQFRQRTVHLAMTEP